MTVAHWFVIASPANHDKLGELGLRYYAVGESARRSLERVQIGDKAILYRSGAATGGIVGAFQVVGRVEENVDVTDDFPFPHRIAWKALAKAEQPVPLKPLVERLKFISHKINYGSSLQGSLRTISYSDYAILLAALGSNQSESHLKS